MTEEQATDSRTSNIKLVKKLVLVSVCMFGFAYALIPMYQVFCDLTGLNGKMDLSAGATRVAEPVDIKIDESRTVTVEFVADSSPGLPWELKPETGRVKVHPGESIKVNFLAKNLSDRDVVARAVPSISPGHGALEFKKTECFCFDEMFLAAQTEEEMPVVFYLTHDFPKDIGTVTLAYKAFDITDKVEVVSVADSESAEIN
jgi:cytochrome c oxidase assembly protein subunit 11